jgi:hypothetical protein
MSGAESPHAVTTADVGWAFRVAAGMTRTVPHFRDEAESAALVGLAHAARDYDPAHAGKATFRTFAARRVAGAVADAMRMEAPAGYRRDKTAHQPGGAPMTGTLEYVVSDGERPVPLSSVIDDGSEPVGWELEYEDEVRGVARRLPPVSQRVFIFHFAHAAGGSQAGAGRMAGVCESQAGNALRIARGVLPGRFAGPDDLFMAGSLSWSGEVTT